MHTPHYTDWGFTDYATAYERQLHTVDQRIHGEISDQLIITEHPATYTLGVRAGAENHLLLSQEALATKGIALVNTNRGGDITYHGPGQLVGYPIISLAQQRDLHAYLRNLEQAIINALGCMGLAAGRRPGKTGIWLCTRKIAAIGIAVKRWVTYHGFAINVNNDLTPFHDIVPCGIDASDGSVTSIQQELTQPVALQELKTIVAHEFWGVFGKSRNAEKRVKS